MKLKKFIWPTSILLIIFFIAAFNIFFNLGNKPLHQDENLHFSTAYGFKETGEFVKWDFLNNRPLEQYTRNFIYTYVVYASNSIFGWNEFSTRLPGAIIGLLGTILIYFVVLLIFKKQVLALAASYIYAINDVIIYFSRFARGYIFLIFISIILFYLSYLISKSNNANKTIKLIGISFLLFILGLHFHPTMILFLPAFLISISLFFLRNYSIKRYHAIYLLFLLGFLFIFLNVIGKINAIPYLNFEEHISLDFEIKNYTFIYLEHLSNPYNFSYNLLFFLPLLLIILWKKNKEISYNFFSFVFIPLMISAYMFNRYEDFRYIALIQPIFIILIPALIYYSINLLRLKNIWKITFFIMLILLTIPFQFPGLQDNKFFTQESHATWENIEAGRIHRRAATPDLEKTFDWIFNQQSERITIIKPSDGGINWNDNYYISKYLERYPSKKIILYEETNYYSGRFDEIYHHSKYYTSLAKNVPYQELIHDQETYIIANLRHLMNQDLLNELEDSCLNIASEIGIVRFNYFEDYSESKNNYYPNVFVC